eukprot:CAMPEP_0185769234 /NCGR_PEP_ID=MMETSP1174-20130828/53459_1 /TAXON_ID=35687 /ORGANISM="Dictyocha speculum, Strain CCMP1381" /LENGTH=430 /DNA_ID=CAMNT_0028454223 /DNA_START=14 /DNA_END=1306 /DNA_ORIENTATION=-
MRACPLILITLLARVNCFPLSPTTSNSGRWGHSCTVTRNSKQPIESSPQFEPVKRVVASAGAALATFFLSVSLGAEPTFAADGAAIGKCLLKSCQVELARCVTDPLCAKNLICIQGCNGLPDEQACQIRCGDLNDNSVIGNFNRCAVTQKQCVPQREDDGTYPIPTEDAIVKKFSTSSFEGRWYITAGYNQIFDAFPCQVHFFTSPKPGLIFGKLTWRVLTPDGFVTRTATQRFEQDPKNPGILYNHDNEYLHYQDDWYVLDADDDFVLVYYRGQNDAWVGYGGAVLYTRTPGLSPELVPRLEAASKKAGIDFKDFKVTDNTCKPKEVRESSTAIAVENRLLLNERAIVEEFSSAARFTSSSIKTTEKFAEKSFEKLEGLIEDEEKMLAKTIQDDEKKVLDLEKSIVQTIEDDEKKVVDIEKRFFKGFGR